jgi:ribonuclease-3
MTSADISKTAEKKADLRDAEKIIGYIFKDKDLLASAFTHSSYSNEHRNSENYERLEFVGDGFLDYSVAMRLYERFVGRDEGILSKYRAKLVSSETLSEIIDECGLIGFLRIGKSAESVLQSEKVKCDLFEAIVGAIIRDCAKDTAEAEKFVFAKLGKYMENVENLCVDYKSKIKEYCEKNNLPYAFETVSDYLLDDNTHIFVSDLIVNGRKASSGKGKSKRLSENAASREYAVNVLGRRNP